MGEALWIRRGTLARMACETINCVILNPRASVSTGARICGCSDTRFFSCFIAISALNMRETRAQHKSSDFASTAAEHLNMHETRATATFAISQPHPIWKCLLFIVFYNMSCLRCAPDSSRSDNSHGPPLHGLRDAAVARVWGTSAHRHARNSSHSDTSMRPPTLPWPALAAALPFLRSLLPSAAAEWAKPSGSAAAHLPAWRVRPSTA